MAKRNETIIWALGALGLLFLLSPKQSAAAPTGGGSGGAGGAGGSGGNGYTPVTGSEGSLNESYLGIAPNGRNRGIRNNNPGNFKMSSANWQGKIPQAQNTDGTFQQYFTYPEGVRMMIKELKNNYIDAGYNTIETLLNRYDPPGNPGYKLYVAGRLGVAQNAVLTSDKETLRKLVQALTRFENDQKSSSSPEVVTNPQFETAWSLTGFSA